MVDEKAGGVVPCIITESWFDGPAAHQFFLLLCVGEALSGFVASVLVQLVVGGTLFSHLAFVLVHLVVIVLLPGCGPRLASWL